MSRPFPAVLLPGIVLPADAAYAGLVAALGDAADARAKELEVYADAAAAEEYTLELEVDGVRRAADAWGFDRFHLVGYSGGGAVALAFAAASAERLTSLTLLEPAWIGWQRLDERERRAWESFETMRDLPEDELMAAFVRAQLRPGVEPPPAREGPAPPWMASRPAGIHALTRAFRDGDLDHSALARFDRPVLYVLGGRSNPDLYEMRARRLAELFRDFTLEVFADRHHFDPPHRIEPERLAAVLLALWRRSSATP